MVGRREHASIWAIKRLSSTDLRYRQVKYGPHLRFNVEYIEKEIMVLTVGNVEGKNVAITYAVTVPVVTNAVAVTKGEDLVMEVAATNPLNKRNDIGWKEHVTHKCECGSTCEASLEER